MNYKRSSTFMILILTLCMAFSVAYGSGPGTSAVNFLNIGVSAKSSATGGAYSAISDGPSATYYNPSGLARVDNVQVAGMHTEWLDGLRYEYLGFASPVGSKGGLGISFTYLTYGGIDGYTDTNQPTGLIDAYDLSAAVSYGHMIKPGFSIGLGFKTVGERLDNVQAFGVAGDAGVQYESGPFLTGLSIMNFGPSLKYENSTSALPTMAKAGVAYTPYFSGLTISAGMAVPFAGEASFQGGIEYSIQNLLTLRTGYDSRSSSDSESGISFGGGLNLSSHSLDYAYNVNSMFGGTHQLSFVFRFGEPRSQSGNASLDYQEPPQLMYTVSEERQSAPASPASTRYYICAAKYSNKESAQKHIGTLKMLDVKAELMEIVDNEFWIVLKEANTRKKAEKARNEFQKNGINCYIEEI